MLVCLVRKLADCVDGVDVSPYGVGDLIDLPERHAHLLLTEGWAVIDRRRESLPLAGRERRFRRNWSSAPERLATAADRSGQRAHDDHPPNLQYDDCEEREARVITTVDEHRTRRRQATRQRNARKGQRISRLRR
jgi:hypothetical protein